MLYWHENIGQEKKCELHSKGRKGQVIPRAKTRIKIHHIFVLQVSSFQSSAAQGGSGVVKHHPSP